MYILENAVTSIARNKGRNLLIGIVILVIACATAVTLAINNSSNTLINSYLDKYEVEATLGVDREKMMGSFDPSNMQESKENMQSQFNSSSQVSVDDIEKYADSEYVKNYYYTLTVGMNASDLEVVSSGTGEETNGDRRGMNQGSFQSSGDFSVRGYSSIEAMNEFIEGKYTITDGQVSEDFEGKECLISSELATLNSLSVGDTITLVDPENEEKTYEFTISGIYAESEEENSNGLSMFSESANTIITNASAVSEIGSADDALTVSTNPTFVLTDRDTVTAFEDELREKGLDEMLSVQTNLEQVESATSTISNVKTFAITFLVITLIIGTVVLLVINMINIRERKYEIGVLRTIGMKKSAVCLQFLSELFIVAVASLCLGAVIGSFISVPVSNHLLASEISSSQNQTNEIRNNFGMKGESEGTDGEGKGSMQKFQGVAVVQAYDSIDAAVDGKVLLELLGIGILITLISGTSAMISIQKFSPLTILKERS